MSNRIEKMLAKTAGMRSARDIPQTEIDPSSRPKTAVGMTAALQSAQLRIAELESRDSAMLLVESILPNPWQPRRKFDADEIKSLADSIAEVGLIQPVVVRKRVSSGDTISTTDISVSPGDTLYELVAGERRLRAHKLLGTTQIKAVVIDAKDEDMAVMALAENVDREDLSDYEVSIAIRRAESEFTNRKSMAEALGISRADLYRYIAFSQMPDFILSDLEISPKLLSRKSAGLLQSVLSEHGSPAVEELRKLWEKVKNETLDHSKLADAVGESVLSSKRVRTDRDIKKLFIGKDQAGSITRDASSLTVKIKTAALSAAKESRLREFVQTLLVEPEQ